MERNTISLRHVASFTPNLLVLPLLFMFTELVAFVLAWTFVLSGPVRHVFARSPQSDDAAESSSDIETQEPTETRKAQ